MLLTTFTKDGRPKPTAIWAAPDGDRLLVITEEKSWKVKRIRNTPRVTLAVCDLRGKPEGRAGRSDRQGPRQVRSGERHDASSSATGCWARRSTSTASCADWTRRTSESSSRPRSRLTEPSGVPMRWQNMAMRFFLIYALVELAVVVALASTIGFGWTVLLLLGTFVVGVALAGSQVRRHIRRLQSGLNASTAQGAVTDSVLVALGTVLVVIPGLASSVLGALLLLPPTRAAGPTGADRDGRPAGSADHRRLGRRQRLCEQARRLHRRRGHRRHGRRTAEPAAAPRLA